MTPRFTHDCTACEFLGRSGDFDLYWCKTQLGGLGGGSLIARHGNEGPDYASGTISSWLASTLSPEDLEKCPQAKALIAVAKQLMHNGKIKLAIATTAAEAAAPPKDRIRVNEKDDQATIALWYKTAAEVRQSDLPTFIDGLINGYAHDYGTICHAMAAAAYGAAMAVEHSPTGGITGFQSGFVFWGFARHWFHWKDDEHHSLRTWANLLFPQYEDEFTGIPKDTWAWAVKKAKERLAEAGELHPEVKAHLQMVAGGVVPFGLKVNDR